MPEVKFCGLTRAADARMATDLGARYVGVIRAGGPRSLGLDAARAVLDGAGAGPRRVGVFGAAPPDVIGAEAADLGLDIVQLHGDPTVQMVAAVRGHFAGAVWAACRVSGAELPPNATALASVADGIVLDRRSARGLGGTGETLPWAELAPAVASLRSLATLVLAGGLRPDNLQEAIRLMSPDVVDVSSGVESAPGVKDHERMREFAAAVTAREVIA